MPKAVIVVGMHRSGTSALTRVLNLVGCDLSCELRPPVPDNNETGFWEPFDVSLIHEEILTSAGSSWDDVSEFPGSWYGSDVARQFQQQLLGILRRDFGSSSLFVLKDPRICRFVPFWLRLLEEFGASPSFVLPIRNPLEVARSLHARDRFPPVKSFLLWLRHVLASECDTRGYRRSFVSYNALMKDWRRPVEKISDDLGIRWPRLSHQAAVEIETFLSPNLWHQHASTHDLRERSDVVEWVTRTYDLVTQALENGSQDLSKGLDEIRAEVDRADMAYGPVVAHGRFLLKASEQKVDALESELAQRSRQLDEGAHQMQELANRTAESSERIARLEREVASRNSSIEHLTAELEASTREVEVRAQQIHDLEEELNAREEQIQALTLEKEETHSPLRALEERVAMRESELNRLAEKEGRLASEIGELSAALADGKTREDWLRKDALRQQGRVQRLTQQISDRDQRIAQLEKDLVGVTGVLMELREAVRRRDREIARQSAEIAGQRAELERMKTALVRGESRPQRVTFGRRTPPVAHPEMLQAV